MKLTSGRALHVAQIDGGLRVFVAPEYAGFREYLGKRDYKVSALGTEKLKVKEWKVGEDGKLHPDEVWLAHEFTTDAPFDKIPQLVSDWGCAGG